MFSQLKMPGEVAQEIGAREKARRKQKKLTQEQLSARAGISLASLKRFEQTGEISFVSLLKIAAVLDELDVFDSLFVRRKYSSIQEVIDEWDS
ncbi:MAG: helix-turn-helix transcriptional regulator [Hungatella sp.]|jgi:transcriptional regulator with XRE-family HTH domain|nr:helix-turn-helix transcriptional regulator [Hungatella sp.]MCI9503356.1 helix-turn-helix transcriptional regulator [Hungatella sp.]MCI9637713.1 helix-turn-helix transcriptional regulator [Hungatella sp.]